MGVYTYIAKRKPQTFYTEDGNKLKVYPLAFANRSSDENFYWYGESSPSYYCGPQKSFFEKMRAKEEKSLAARHRMAARAWEYDFHVKDFPLVVIVKPYYGELNGKWEPAEGAGAPLYRFTGGSCSEVLIRENSVFGDVPCFWYDFEDIGEKVGQFVNRDGKWVIKGV